MNSLNSVITGGASIRQRIGAAGVDVRATGLFHALLLPPHSIPLDVNGPSGSRISTQEAFLTEQRRHPASSLQS